MRSELNISESLAPELSQLIQLNSWLTIHSTCILFVAHNRKNRQKDKGCVMTTVFRRAKPYHKIRSLEDELVTIVDSETNKVLHFERVYNNRRLQIPLVRKRFQLYHILLTKS